MSLTATDCKSSKKDLKKSWLEFSQMTGMTNKEGIIYLWTKKNRLTRNLSTQIQTTQSKAVINRKKGKAGQGLHSEGSRKVALRQSLPY